MKKDFYKISDLSEEFDEWLNAVRDPQSKDFLEWQCKFQLAIAQQLAMVSTYLGRIVGKAEKLNDQN